MAHLASIKLKWLKVISAIKDILQLLKDILCWFRPQSTPVFKKPQETSEQIEEEEVGELTMIADKMLERLNKKRNKK